MVTPTERNELVTAHMGLARGLARKYRRSGEELEDLEQVAMYGLIQAAERFDANHGSRFESFASVTIMGELKRHLRDKAWTVRVPRGLKETSRRVTRVSDELRQTLMRSPTTAEIAEVLDIPEEQVLEAMQIGSAYMPTSLNTPLGTDEGDGDELISMLGSDDELIEMSARWSDAAAALSELDERSRHILYQRFFVGQSQSEIADVLGISQMHVSRLLKKALDAVRSAVD
ncbi:MAG: SigB/SigF/SigG family RNA polymerase sigma factor [Acidimicrobiia bacterium]|nr:SigB/SigF/SigG family RNA polymerase sigma factor [Acidimicrobiia bacterium]NNC43016.1 SigB/SigF/SigG family RNA polymerase sigma factor [Acidimicrobiia bacterium]NNL48714.1 SigB/SigF/SigG family RNA polymerase sigma factor [Acidimicrobiia bacterium]